MDYRLTPLLWDDLDEPQRRLWRRLQNSSRGATAVRQEGYLTGPFDVLLRSPSVGEAIAELGGRLRFGSGLSPRHREIVILVVLARWRAAFAWVRHRHHAHEAGVPEQAIEAIARRSRPALQRDDAVVFDLIHELTHTGSVGEVTYQRAAALLGERALVEAVALCGYYCMTSVLMNGFQVPPPQDAPPTWRVSAAGERRDSNEEER